MYQKLLLLTLFALFLIGCTIILPARQPTCDALSALPWTQCHQAP